MSHETKTVSSADNLSLATQEVSTSVAKSPMLPKGWNLATPDDLEHLFSLRTFLGYPRYRILEQMAGGDELEPSVSLNPRGRIHRSQQLSIITHIDNGSFRTRKGKNMQEQARDALRQVLQRLRDDKDTFAAEIYLTSSPLHRDLEM